VPTGPPPAPRKLDTVKPRLRGVSHQYAFFVALAAGAALVVLARGGEARVAVAVYALSLCAMFGASALYHRIDWQPRPRAWLRRLDHSMIFVLVAGTYTPFAVLVLAPALGWTLLGVVWGGALAGIALSLLWVDAPRWLSAAVYVALGWVAVVGLPQLWDRAGAMAVALLATGGVLYTVGAVVYARRRPDPAPRIFGYHEIFHVLVIAAAAVHFAAIAVYAV
jgi:hemolysin III